MASCQQSKIQSYLEKNKIGPLFEEMMTRLISETPDQPVPFLISHLQDRQGGPAHLQKVLLGPAALWAQAPNTVNPTEPKMVRWDLKEHEKPCQEHARRHKRSKSDLEVCSLSPPSPESKSLPGSSERPLWDSRGRTENHEFDELSHILLESRKLGQALESLSRSLAASDELDQKIRAFNSPFLRPRVIGRWTGRMDSDADPLAAEMLQPPLPRAHRDTNEPTASLKMVPKSRSLKQQQLNHKKQLAAMLAEESINSSGSPEPSYLESDIDEEDDAMELLEDLDDLRMEGVTRVLPSRTKASPWRPAYNPQPQAKLTLNICSRCARLQGVGLPDMRDEEEQCAQEVPEVVTGPHMEQRTSLKDSDSLLNVTGPSPPGWIFDLARIKGWSSVAQNPKAETLNTPERTGGAEKDIGSAAGHTSGKVPSRSALDGLLLSSSLHQSTAPLSELHSKPTGNLSLLGNKPTSLLLSPSQVASNPSARGKTPTGSLILPPSALGGHACQDGSTGVFPLKGKNGTTAGQAGQGRTFTSAHQVRRSRPTTPTGQGGWGTLTTPTNQGGWGMPTTPTSQAGWNRTVTPTKDCGWSMSTTPPKQSGWSIPSTPTYQSGWSMSTTPPKQSGWSIPSTPTYQSGWSMSATPLKRTGWSIPSTPTYQSGRCTSTTPPKQSGWSIPSTPTYQSGWSLSATQPKQSGWSIPSTPTYQSGWSMSANLGGRSQSVTAPSETVRGRSITPTTQAGRSRSLTPTSQTGRSRSVTPTNQTGRRRSVTPTDPTARRLLTPTGISGDNLLTTVNQTSILSEADFCQQLQAMSQPWVLPSDTESDSGIAESEPAGTVISARGFQ